LLRNVQGCPLDCLDRTTTLVLIHPKPPNVVSKFVDLGVRELGAWVARVFVDQADWDAQR
jgi:hypothetical protein